MASDASTTLRDQADGAWAEAKANFNTWANSGCTDHRARFECWNWLLDIFRNRDAALGDCIEAHLVAVQLFPKCPERWKEHLDAAFTLILRWQTRTENVPCGMGWEAWENTKVDEYREKLQGGWELYFACEEMQQFQNAME